MLRTALLASLLLLGCDGTESPPTSDAGPPSVGTDAGPPSVGTDAGPPGTTDAGPGGVDAGPPVASSGCGVAPGANDRRWTVTHDGREREFFVHLPTGYAPSTPTPVVLDFHGRNTNASLQMTISGMKSSADANGFIAVHAEGIGATWNGGLCCGEAMSANIDDVGFVDALLDRLNAELCVDEARVFATGLSNGGYISNRLGCELSDRIAAIAPVAGPNVFTSCSPSRPVPVLHFHGTDDRIVPYDGFAGALGVRDTMEAWAQRNGCGTSTSVYFTNGDVTCEEWSGCGAASVQLCTVDGGGHQWPGGNSIPLLGDNTNDISATDAIWDFFAAHPMP